MNASITMKLITITITVMACGSGVFAEPRPLVRIEHGQAVDPIEIAPILNTGELGAWRPYVATDGNACWEPIYDSFEAVRIDDPCEFGQGHPADGEAAGGFDPFCDIANVTDPCEAAVYRWFFGLDYVHAGRRSSGVVATLAPGADVCRLALAWHNALDVGERDPNGNIIGDTVITVNVHDGAFDQMCGDEIPDRLGGVAMNFGPLSGGEGSYRFANINLAALDLDLRTPSSGEIGIDVQFWYDAGATIPAANNQLMLWGPKSAEIQGVALPIVYDDDNWDGVYDNLLECFDYSGLVSCPELVQSMVALYGGEPDLCSTFEYSELVAGEKVTVEIEGAEPNASYVWFGFTEPDRGQDVAFCLERSSPSEPPMKRVMECFDGEAHGNVLCRGVTDATGAGSCTFSLEERWRGDVYGVLVILNKDGSFCVRGQNEVVE